MGHQDLFKSSIISALNKSYLLDRWIGDELLVIILQDNYNLGDFLNKRYLNRYLPNLSLNNYKYYNTLQLPQNSNKRKAVLKDIIQMHSTIIQLKIKLKKIKKNTIVDGKIH